MMLTISLAFLILIEICLPFRQVGNMMEYEMAIRKVQGGLVDFVKALADESADLKMAQLNSEAPEKSQRTEKRNMEMLKQALIQVDQVHKRQCDAFLIGTRPRLEFLDSAISRTHAAVDKVRGKPTSGTSTVDMLHRSLTDTSEHLRLTGWQLEQANIHADNLQRELADTKQRLSFSQLSLAAATADARSMNVEVCALREAIKTTSVASGNSAMQQQLQGFQRSLRQADEDRGQEREEARKLLLDAQARYNDSETAANQLRKDLRSMKVALKSAKRREGELDMKITKQTDPHPRLTLPDRELSAEELLALNQQLLRHKLRLAGSDQSGTLRDEVQLARESLDKVSQHSLVCRETHLC